MERLVRGVYLIHELTGFCNIRGAQEGEGRFVLTMLTSGKAQMSVFGIGDMEKTLEFFDHAVPESSIAFKRILTPAPNVVEYFFDGVCDDGRRIIGDGLHCIGGAWGGHVDFSVNGQILIGEEQAGEKEFAFGVLNVTNKDLIGKRFRVGGREIWFSEEFNCSTVILTLHKTG
jgi:hypothetical protein